MRPRIVVAPDSFKGSLGAADVARSVAAGIAGARPDAEVLEVPLSDGGEGWVEALSGALGAEPVAARVADPLGTPIEALYSIAVIDGTSTAIIESAAASGLHLIAPERRDPRFTSTLGTGELVLDALGRGARRMLMGLGGSATNDAGAGMASALGARFLDAGGRPVAPGGIHLAEVSRIDAHAMDARLEDVAIVAACDVDNPLTGPSGASLVYGPQKGADYRIAHELDHALDGFADVVAASVGRDVRDEFGAGAAGGLGFGLMAFCGAATEPGIDVALDALGVEEMLQGADLVVTGEGRIDRQSLRGKVVVGIARRARELGIEVAAIAGTVDDGGTLLDDLRAAGVGTVIEIAGRAPGVQEVLHPDESKRRLERAGRSLAQSLLGRP